MEHNLNDKFLPIGTVVCLQNVKKRFMITGFCSVAKRGNTGIVYDYSGCLFPEGFANNSQTALFNHDQIEEIVHLGLRDEEDKLFKNKLNDMFECANYMAWGDVDNLVVTKNVEQEQKFEDFVSYNSFNVLPKDSEITLDNGNGGSLYGNDLNSKSDVQTNYEVVNDEKLEQSTGFYDEVTDVSHNKEVSLYPDVSNSANTFMPQSNASSAVSYNMNSNFNLGSENNLSSSVNKDSYSNDDKINNSSLQSPLNSSVTNLIKNTNQTKNSDGVVQLDFSYKTSSDEVQKVDTSNNSHVNINRNKFLIE